VTGVQTCALPICSERRLEYTAIGDAANTAARLEKLTKELGHALLLADSTHALVTDPPGDLVAVGEVTVRGRRAPTRLWSIEEHAAVPIASIQGSTAA